MKKLISLILCACIVMGMLPLSSAAYVDPLEAVHTTLKDYDIYVDISKDLTLNGNTINGDRIAEQLAATMSQVDVNVTSTVQKVDTTDLSGWYVYSHYDQSYWGTDSEWMTENSMSSTNDTKQPLQWATANNSNYLTPIMLKDNLSDLNTARFYDSHIYSGTENSGAFMIFAGYYTDGYFDYLIYPTTSSGTKQVDYTVDATGVQTHSMRGAGFLINAGVDASGYLHGYFVYIEYFPKGLSYAPTSCNIHLYKIKDNVLATSFSDDRSTCDYKLSSYCTEIGSGETPGSLPMLTNVSMSITNSQIEMTLTAQGALDPYYTKTWSGLENTNFKGFGPCVCYDDSDGHSCTTVSAYKYTNLQMSFSDSSTSSSIMKNYLNADFLQDSKKVYAIIAESYFSSAEDAIIFDLMREEGAILISNQDLSSLIPTGLEFYRISGDTDEELADSLSQALNMSGGHGANTDFYNVGSGVNLALYAGVETASPKQVSAVDKTFLDSNTLKFYIKDLSVNKTSYIKFLLTDPDGTTQPLALTDDGTTGYFGYFEVTNSLAEGKYTVTAQYYNDEDCTEATGVPGCSYFYMNTSYEVVLDANGGTISGTVNDGSMLLGYLVDGEPFGNFRSAERTGYTFGGWYLKDETGSLSTMVKSTDAMDAESYSGNSLSGTTVTLFAKWTPKTYTVMLNSGKGSGGAASVMATYGSAIPHFTKPSKAGSNLKGFTDNKGVFVIDANGNLITGVDGYSDENGYWARDNGAVLTAQFNYTATFMNGSTKFAAMDANEEGLLVVPAEWPDSATNTFLGWASTQYRLTNKQPDVLPGDNVTLNADVTYYAVWKNNSFAVTLPADADEYAIASMSGSSSPVNGGGSYSFTVTVPASYNISNMAVCANGLQLGYTAVNADPNDCGKERVFSYTVSNIYADQNITVTGITKKTFTVILNNGTGYTVDPVSSTVAYGDDYQFTVTLGAGYTQSAPVVYINGELKTAENENDTYNYTVANVTAVLVISISATANPQYTVTFYHNGTVFAQSVVENGKTISIPETDPEKAGYLFSGWYNADKEYDFSAPVTGTLNLTAMFGANSYMIEFDANEGSGSMPPMYGSYDTAATLKNNEFTRVGYTFTCWNTEYDGSGTAYVDKASVMNLASTGTVTHYAQWSRNVYPVTLTAGEGVTAGLDCAQAGYGDIVIITMNIGSAYRDAQITASPAENAELVDGTEYQYTITGPVAFSISATAKTVYTAKFYVDGGLYYIQSALEGSGDTIELPVPPTKESAQFDGWYIDSAQVTAESEISSNMTVVAHWKANTYDVTLPDTVFYGTLSKLSDSPVEYDGSFTFDLTINEHYNADDIQVASNGILLTPTEVNGNVYSYKIINIQSSQLVTINNITADVYTVTFMVNGKVYHSMQIPYNTAVPEPVDPVIESLSFAGWYLGDQEYGFDTLVTDDITLNARWEDGVFGIEYFCNEGTINDTDYPTEYTFGTETTLPADVAREGYVFSGWFDNSSCSGDAITSISAQSYGKLRFYAKWTLEDMSTSDYTGVYDGKAHYIGVVISTATSEESYQWYYREQPTDNWRIIEGAAEQTYPVKAVSQSGQYYCNVNLIEKENNIRKNYDSSVITVQITKRSVTLTADTASKVYDAEELNCVSAKDTSIGSNTGLSDGHTCTVITTPESKLTNVGSKPNKLEKVIILDEYKIEVTENYETTFTDGLLTVSRRPITIQADDGNKIYDGAALNISTAKDVTTETVDAGLVDGHTIAAVMTTDSTITQKGTAVNTIVSLQILEDTTDVTANYFITMQTGTLTVTARPVTLKTKSAEAVYSGNALQLTGYEIVFGSLASTDAMNAVYPSITATGFMVNKPTPTVTHNTLGDVTDSYLFTYESGKLTVMPLTTPPTDITATGAKLQMLVGDNTADTFGFVYGTHESNLTQKINATGTGSDRSAELTGLRTGTVYYARAYMTVNGEDIYGNMIRFETVRPENGQINVVVNNGNTNSADFTVTIEAGNTILATAKNTVPGSGSQTVNFNGMPDGVYHIAIRSRRTGSDSKIIEWTNYSSVTIINRSIAFVSFTIPGTRGSFNTIVDVSVTAANIAIGGINALETIEDRLAVAEGAVITITASIDTSSSTGSDIQLVKKAVKSDGSVVTERLSQLNHNLEISIPMTEYQIENANRIKITRTHNGQVEYLTRIYQRYSNLDEAPDGTCFVDTRIGYIFIYSRLFSLFDVVIDTPTPPATPISTSTSVTRYSIEANCGENGQISPIGKTEITYNETATFTIKPDEGYQIADVLVDGKSIGAVDTYTFSQVTGNHEIYAQFTASAWNNPFNDVMEQNWFYDDVWFVYKKGLMLGVSDRIFAPGSTVTRGMIVTILWRLENQPEVKITTAFKDIDPNAWYAEAISWAAENKIVNGYGNDMFGPNDSITREQLASILYRYAQVKQYTVNAETSLDAFADAKNVSRWAETAVKWACGSGLLSGTNNGELLPTGNATRAQVASILHRFVEKFM